MKRRMFVLVLALASIALALPAPALPRPSTIKAVGPSQSGPAPDCPPWCRDWRLGGLCRIGCS